MGDWVDGSVWATGWDSRRNTGPGIGQGLAQPPKSSLRHSAWSHTHLDAPKLLPDRHWTLGQTHCLLHANQTSWATEHTAWVWHTFWTKGSRASSWHMKDIFGPLDLEQHSKCRLPGRYWRHILLNNYKQAVCTMDSVDLTMLMKMSATHQRRSVSLQWSKNASIHTSLAVHTIYIWRKLLARPCFWFTLCQYMFNWPSQLTGLGRDLSIICDLPDNLPTVRPRILSPLHQPAAERFLLISFFFFSHSFCIYTF